MPDIYFKSVPFSKEDVTLALESGVDGIITEAEHVEGVRSLALCDVRAEADMPSVGQCFDLFMEYDVYIQTESVARIQHTLRSVESSPEAIKVVYSHPQALAQCQRWLRQHLPEASLMACDSTAAAARRAVSEPGSAAIGHKSLSTMLGLPILAYNLEDEPTNQTRFVVIGPKPTDTSAANKTSVLFTLPDKPGSLAGILELLFKAGVNLRKLESRPLRSQSWKYAFFADLETNLL